MISNHLAGVRLSYPAHEQSTTGVLDTDSLISEYTMQVLHYLDSSGHDIYQDWLDRLRDVIGRIAIQRRIDRIADTGNVGNCSFCNDGVWELKIDVGPGYRVYYVEIKKTAILLLCGGTKRKQKVVILLMQ